MQIEQSILGLFFPKGTLDWFEVVEGKSDENNVYITLKEKNIPPVEEKDKGKEIEAVKFHDITITDFPLRGKRMLLTFRSRYVLYKPENKWTKDQRQRANILFAEFPDLQSAHHLSMMFRSIYEHSTTKEQAKERLDAILDCRMRVV